MIGRRGERRSGISMLAARHDDDDDDDEVLLLYKVKFFIQCKEIKIYLLIDILFNHLHLFPIHLAFVEKPIWEKEIWPIGIRYYHSGARVDLGAMVMDGVLRISPKLQHHGNLTIRLFNVIVVGGYTILQRRARRRRRKSVTSPYTWIWPCAKWTYNVHNDRT